MDQISDNNANTDITSGQVWSIEEAPLIVLLSFISLLSLVHKKQFNESTVCLKIIHSLNQDEEVEKTRSPYLKHDQFVYILCLTCLPLAWALQVS